MLNMHLKHFSNSVKHIISKSSFEDLDFKLFHFITGRVSIFPQNSVLAQKERLCLMQKKRLELSRDA